LSETTSVSARLGRKWEALRAARRIDTLAAWVTRHAQPDPSQAPVVLFNASARLGHLSQNAAFQLLTGWALRLAGAPVVQFSCARGLTPCMLGTNREDYRAAPPCGPCLRQSAHLYAGTPVQQFRFSANPDLEAALAGLDVPALLTLTYPGPLPGGAEMPLGALVQPSIRWALRRHTLPDDEATRGLLRGYLRSAYNVAQHFGDLLARLEPQQAVIFNGMMYPEASARWVSRQMGVPSVTHEVGFQRLSTFFTRGEATAYPAVPPDDYQLDAAANARLDAYLEQRLRGQFTMAGIQFWPEMRRLEPEFLARAAQFQQVVPIFTNVVYDTSQAHANVIFPHMFAWLELLRTIIARHPETLFVIRAHPDEMRVGTAKLSNESVAGWVAEHGLDTWPNVAFVDAQAYLSSYELIGLAPFVIAYNSSIGLEATLLGKPVVVGGKARYTSLPMVHFPPSPEALAAQIEALLAHADPPPPAWIANARRLLAYQLYRASLPLDDYLETAPRMGLVHLRRFYPEKLRPENSPSLNVIVQGILHAAPFILPEAT
jgi:hypothetical protein